jgi:hypothetical protein|tara:strand:+ start:1720 stop:2001 length:282 start_codon:yes stop_codon:yes gene_type:complete
VNLNDDKLNKRISSSKKGNKSKKNNNDFVVKRDESKIKERSITQKSNRRIKETKNENPLEDVEILRAMGMQMCNVCKCLYPLYLNRCPQCIES